jgi:hypothetical protein
MKKKYVTVTSIGELQPGDIIKHVRDGIAGGEPLLVTANYGGHAIAIVTAYVSAPDEWLVMRDAKR